ncbi:hypothetical protein AWV80_15705 [Cupriavidus sp. UYMU48A]|nr:hypothetical protein AWV80_15705 [Cupriavidus sp. UYMU48A]
MLRILYPLFLVEAVIGGGGRMAGFAPVSVRWIVAALCLAVTALHLIVRGLRIPVTTVSLMMAYSWMLCAGTIVGLLRGNDTAQIVADVGQLSYFFIFPFVFHYFQMEGRARRTTERFLVYPAVVLAIVYFFALYLIFGQGRLSKYTKSCRSVMIFSFAKIRPFFYKSFLYLGVACFFSC